MNWRAQVPVGEDLSGRTPIGGMSSDLSGRVVQDQRGRRVAAEGPSTHHDLSGRPACMIDNPEAS